MNASPYFDESTICDLFTDAQAAELGFDGLTLPLESEYSASCNRDTAAGRRPHVSLTIRYIPDDFLQGVYNGQSGDPDEWRPTVIVEQPAAIITRKLEQIACRVVIGISNQQGVEVIVSTTDTAVQKCDLAVSIAETIVHNLGG